MIQWKDGDLFLAMSEYVDAPSKREESQTKPQRVSEADMLTAPEKILADHLITLGFRYKWDYTGYPTVVEDPMDLLLFGFDEYRFTVPLIPGIRDFGYPPLSETILPS